MKALVRQNTVVSELLRLLEIRRRQVMSAFVTGWAAGMCIIELLRVLKVVPEPIGWAIGFGMLVPFGIFSLIGSEIRIRKALSRIVSEMEAGPQQPEQNGTPE